MRSHVCNFPVTQTFYGSDEAFFVQIKAIKLVGYVGYEIVFESPVGT